MVAGRLRRACHLPTSTPKEMVSTDEATRELPDLASIEAPCEPCAYGQHEACLWPIGEQGNCCCDELDGWAERS
jgi:hypothetical protein